jgi:nucleotide-binding universal stress UspA family protein
MEISDLYVATDLSAHSGVAARWALKMKGICQAPVRAAHIIELSVPNWMKGTYEVEEDPEIREEEEEKVRKWFRVHTDDEADEVIVRAGHANKQLRELVADSEHPVLVASKSGKGSLMKFLAGSTVQALASRPPCTLVVVSDERAGLEPGMQVVLATDLTNYSRRALRRAASLVEDLGGELVVIHALGVPEDVRDDDLPGTMTYDEMKRQALERLETYLEEESDALEGIEVRDVLVEGETIPAISKYIEEHDVQLLIAGHVTGEEGIIENEFRRVTLRLISGAGCSLMIVPVEI